MAGKRKSRSSSTKEHKNNDEEADAYLTPSKGMMNGEFDSDSEDEGEMLRIMRQVGTWDACVDMFSFKGDSTHSLSFCLYAF